MRLDLFVIGIALFGLIMFLGVNIAADLESNYDNVTISTSKFNLSELNKGSEVKQDALDQSNRVVGEGGEIDDDATEDSMFKGAFKALRLTKNSVGYSTSIINELGKELKVPEEFVSFGLLVIMIAVIFGVIFIIFRVSKG